MNPPLWLSVIAAGFAASMAPALAHDFWIQPATYQTDTGTPVSFTFQVGHGADRQRWSGRMERVVQLRSIAPGGGIDDRRSGLRLGQADDGVLTFAATGTHVVAFESTHATSTLPAAKFNAYLTEEGLTPAIERRALTRAREHEGREIYSRRAKALVCVGASDGLAAHVSSPVGFTLELVPERDPCTLPAGEALPVRVYYDGRPLPGALVKLTNLDLDMRTFKQHVSDGEGRTTFDVPRTGSWLLNVVWTRPLQGHPTADFDTVFSSLTFGFVPPDPSGASVPR